MGGKGERDREGVRVGGKERGREMRGVLVSMKDDREVERG